MRYHPLQTLQDNIAAIRIALQWQPEKGLSAADSAVMQRYSGFGGIKAILYPYGSIEEWKKLNATSEDLRLYADIQALHELLQQHFPDTPYKEVVQSLKNSVLTAFYTPPVVAGTLYQAISDTGVQVKRLFEPSSGAGIFLTEAVKHFSELEKITCVEKDVLTSRVLEAIASNLPVPSTVHSCGFEQTPLTDNQQYDLIVSNIPFGNFKVQDSRFTDPAITSKIHNYFFAKGLDKLAEGGLLGYITTDAFLNNPSNKPARSYLFNNADFVSLAVMPDNLMKDTGNTEAPSHLLVVQKRSNKPVLSESEKLLVETVAHENEYGTYRVNHYLSGRTDLITGNETEPGKNQYGAAHKTVWQTGDINAIRVPLQTILENGFQERFNKAAFQQIRFAPEPVKQNHLSFHFLPVPKEIASSTTVQLGLFDTGAVQPANRALAYLTAQDKAIVQPATARIISTVKTSNRPEHESIVLLTAKQAGNNRFTYKLYSNIEEIQTGPAWLTATDLHLQLSRLSQTLNQYNYQYLYSGDKLLEPAFGLSGEETRYYTQIQSFYKEGTMVTYQGIAGKLTNVDTEHGRAEFEPYTKPDKTAPFYQDYIAVRDALFILQEKESATEKEAPEFRDLLQSAYSHFITSHGPLNATPNRKAILSDEAFGFVTLSSIERKEEGQFIPADILSRPLFQTDRQHYTDDVTEALARSLNDKGSVNIEYIADLTRKQPIEAIEGLADHILLNPVSSQWETKDAYLSGNVVSKLQAALVQVQEHPQDLYRKNSLGAIQKVQPEKIPFELLDFNLGERWMPLDYYQRFATQLFETETSITYLPSVDSFKVVPDEYNAKVRDEFSVLPKSGKTMYGQTLLEHALENTSPHFTYEVNGPNGEPVRIPDNEAIQLAHQKIESIRSQYVEWLNQLSLPEKKAIETLYNETFNCYVLRNYDGAHLQFPGLDKSRLGITDLYASQKDAAWRIIQNRGGLIDHEVGLGKTLTMVAASREMKRLGIVHKPMILALKANVLQIASTYRNAYPHAKILAPNENDFSPKNRQRLFFEIKNNNWDCIILTHDQFGKIPQSDRIQQETFEKELDNVERDLYTLKELGGNISKKMLKGLEVRRSNLAVALNQVLERIEKRKDSDIDFESMGVDHLFVDESHKFKNLTFTTRHSRVAGLGNMEGSQKALNMLFAVRTLQDKFQTDLCVTFLSGTPISNSLTEMYLLFKYLRPNEMERQRIENFDGWAAVFAKKTVDFEFSVTNEIIAKERFRHFIKVPELALFYNEITDYKTAKHIQLDKPQLEEHLVGLKPTSDQQDYIKRLMQFAKTGDGTLIGRPPLTEAEDKSRMLLATNYSKKMAADMRLINPVLYEDDPGNKVSACAGRVAFHYQESSPHRGTQIIFCDIGTPKNDEFNLYDALKEKLVSEHLVPAEQITFIHDWTDARKPELFRRMNSGDIRILIGSTEKAGTGLNVQERVIAMHHLDIPWKPSELDQRNGRGARQGNRIAKAFYGNKVQNYVYAVAQSLDNYKFNLLKNKQLFISQMKNSELHVRTIDEGAMDEQSGMNFSEYIAVLSGDTSLLEKSKLEKKIAVLESLRAAHVRETVKSRYRLEDIQAEKEKTTGIVTQLATDESLYKSRLRLEPDGAKSNPIRIPGAASADPEVIGKYLIDCFTNWKPQNPEKPFEKIGELYGFDLFIRQEKQAFDNKGLFEYLSSNSLYASNSNTNIKYTFNKGQINKDHPKLAARYFLNAIDRVESLKKHYQKILEELEKDLPVVQKMATQPFEKDKELCQLKSELHALDNTITQKIQAAYSISAETSEPATPTIYSQSKPAMASEPLQEWQISKENHNYRIPAAENSVPDKKGLHIPLRMPSIATSKPARNFKI